MKIGITYRLFLSILAATCLAVLSMFLIAKYDEVGWGLSLIWVAAVFAFFGGFVMIFRAFRDRNA